MSAFVRRLTLGLIGLVAAETGLLAADAALPPPLARAQRASPVALDRNGAWLRALPVERGRWRIRADLDRTDPIFVKRLVAVEDARFYSHPGVDPIAVVRALGAAALSGHVRSGASTLTMQTARLLEPRRRTLGAKLIETLRALQLEARFSKRRILALYLTLAPYGGNLEGVRAASLAYFGHEPESLTDGEQALLIALPQSPEARRPDRRPAAARAARQAVLDKLVRAGLADPARRRRGGRRAGSRAARRSRRWPGGSAASWRRPPAPTRPRWSPPSTRPCSAGWRPWSPPPPPSAGAAGRGGDHRGRDPDPGGAGRWSARPGSTGRAAGWT